MRPATPSSSGRRGMGRSKSSGLSPSNGEKKPKQGKIRKSQFVNKTKWSSWPNL